MNAEIVVMAVGEVPASVLAHLCAALTGTFERPCRVGEIVPVPEHAFDPRRAQYSAQALLQQLLPGQVERVLGVVDLDLYVPRLNFVFGLADWASGSTARAPRRSMRPGSCSGIRATRPRHSLYLKKR